MRHVLICVFAVDEAYGQRDRWTDGQMDTETGQANRQRDRRAKNHSHFLSETDDTQVETPKNENGVFFRQNFL